MSDRRKHNKTIEITYRDEVGETDSRTFAKWMGIGTTAMLLTLVMVLSVGMIAGALGVGIGGFVASFGNVVVDPVQGNGGAIYPVLGQQPACANAPQLNAHLPGTANITGHVAFYKDLPLPSGSWTNYNTARVNIISTNIQPGDVQLQDLDLRLSALNASLLSLNASAGDEIEIRESATAVDPPSSGGDAYQSYGNNGTGDDPPQTLDASNVFNNTEFGIAIPNGSNVTIDQGIAAAHQVAFSSVTLPDVDMFVTIGNSSTQWVNQTGVANRTVTPAQRTCAALGAASSPSSYGGTYP